MRTWQIITWVIIDNNSQNVMITTKTNNKDCDKLCNQPVSENPNPCSSLFNVHFPYYFQDLYLLLLYTSYDLVVHKDL